MKQKTVLKRLLTVSLIVIGILILTAAAALILLEVRTNAMLDDYSSVYDNEKYQKKVTTDNVEVITQDISCGYAVIEMFSSWDGKSITEETLYNEYGRVVTSTGKSFRDEMNKQFPEYTTTMHKYLSNTELIDKAYNSLSKGIPVPFEWAAPYNGEWTLHYSLITGMDIPNDEIVIANPYGYYETLSLNDFLDRTGFEAYSEMPLYLKLAFAFGIFEKNTIFTVE